MSQRKRLLFLAMLLSGVMACEDRASTKTRGASTIPNDFSIRLTRGGCEGNCPIYSVRVDGQGRVVWKGERFVRETGTATKNVDGASLQSAMRRARELDILALQPGIHPCLDQPLVTIDLAMEGRSNSVAYCQGDARPEAHRLVEFAAFVDRMVADEDWIGSAEDRRMK